MARKIIIKLLHYLGLYKSPYVAMEVFNAELKKFKELNNSERFSNTDFGIYPCMDDKTTTTSFDAHYIYHPAWAARIIKQINPLQHIDISSSLHFCTILSAFIPTKFYDYRPALLNLDNLTSESIDLTDLRFKNNSQPSLSCMHTIEHIGLGRYGDMLDPDGDIKAINELARVCSVGGSLLLVVPVGKKRILFNAHRIYEPKEFASYLANFKVADFSLITDDGSFINNATYEHAAEQNYGCGCYWFIKLAA
ncbi:DUF268 domain-containing protein [Mucilaginibacter rigui]|uniref:DUF268 domain-containing protein n=2 Tax=Mucilaginibacter rigui TaxID=534635 RepID=A0ABR7X8C5_9SPHI|nr:DUF268 domain-containing protein [Mucilaginibacter rigui]